MTQEILDFYADTELPIGHYPSYVYSPEFGPDYENAIRTLIADEIRRRVQDVREELPSTDVLIYGEMFDPQHYGGYVNTYQTLGILSSASYVANGVTEYVKDHLVLMPWQYTNTYTHDLESEMLNADLVWHVEVTDFIPAPECFVCPLLPPMFQAICWGSCGLDAVEAAIPDKVDVTVNMSALGVRYDPSATFDHYISHGFKFAYAWGFDKGLDPLTSHALSPAYEYVDAVENLSVQDRTNYYMGFAAVVWEVTWEDTTEKYHQSEAFNSYEILASANNTAPGKGTSAWRSEGLAIAQLGVMVDGTPTNAVNYLDVNRNIFHPDCEVTTDEKNEVTWFDAILYCNRLSEREGLTPVYPFTSLDYDNYLSNPTIVAPTSLVSVNPAANGYRLPTPQEYFHIWDEQGTLNATVGDIEWVCPLYAGDTPQFTVAFGPSHTTQDAYIESDAWFRVVRSPPLSLTLSGVLCMKGLHVARDELSIVDASLEDGSSLSAMAGGMIRVLPETHFERGSNVHLWIDPEFAP